MFSMIVRRLRAFRGRASASFSIPRSRWEVAGERDRGGGRNGWFGVQTVRVQGFSDRALAGGRMCPLGRRWTRFVLPRVPRSLS